jgi:hypothetical protein
MGFGFGHASHLPVPPSERDHVKRYSAFHGALVVIAGCAMLIGLSFGAMVLLTGPDGWITKAANTAMANDSGTVLTAYTIGGQ